MNIDREPVAGDLSGFYYHREFGIIDKNHKGKFDAEKFEKQVKEAKLKPDDIKVTKEFTEYLV